MYYRIDYSVRQKDALLHIIDREEHLADIVIAGNIANALQQELKTLYDELCGCVRDLRNRIDQLEGQIRQAEQMAAAANARAAQAEAQLRATPTTKTVNPSPEEAKNGAKPQQVPINQDVIASLKAEIAKCRAEANQQQQIAKDLKAKQAPLKNDLDILKKGVDRVEDYLDIADNACTRLHTAHREAKFLCEDRVIPDIKTAEELMEQYNEVEITPLFDHVISPIREKEGW